MHWGAEYQNALQMQKTSLVYPDFSKEFEIYTDGVSTQIGAIITQKNWPLAFFSGNLIKCQKKYSVIKLDLLSK